MPLSRSSQGSPEPLPGIWFTLAGVAGACLCALIGAIAGWASSAQADHLIAAADRAAINGTLAGLYGLVAGLTLGLIADAYRLWAHQRRSHPERRHD
jgi:hypothetical protein